MTLRHLEIFLAVAETGSMRKAAEGLYISQPTVSGAIREIEAEYDVLLFERLNQRLFITPEGRQLTIYAREILSLFHEMEYTLRHSSDHAILRIGATLTVGTCVLPEILRQLEEQKHIPTSVQVENTRTIVQRTDGRGAGHRFCGRRSAPSRFGGTACHGRQFDCRLRP